MVERNSDLGGRNGSARVRIEPVRWNGSGRVALIGEIDLGNVPDTEAALIDRASSGSPLTLDLVGLSYLDSQGIALFCRLAQRASLNGGSLTLANPHGIVRRVLEVARIGDAVAIIQEV